MDNDIKGFLSSWLSATMLVLLLLAVLSAMAGAIYGIIWLFEHDYQPAGYISLAVAISLVLGFYIATDEF